MYSSCGEKKDCWVCEGYGKNKCIVCLDEKTGELKWQLVIPKLGAGKVSDWE